MDSIDLKFADIIVPLVGAQVSSYNRVRITKIDSRMDGVEERRIRLGFLWFGHSAYIQGNARGEGGGDAAGGALAPPNILNFLFSLLKNI